MKFCVAVLSFLLVTSGQDPFSNVPLENPFESALTPPFSEAKISGKVIASLKGDYVHPTFSPDGNTLAYSKVLVRAEFESTEVLLYDLNSRKTSIVLDSKRAERYATYKVYVAEMNWRSPRRLEVVVGDGDVDSTHLVLDPQTRRLLIERSVSADELDAEPLSPTQRKARHQVFSLFPEFPREVLDSALMNSALVIPDKGIVLQKNYAGHDDNIWFLDFETRSVNPLVNLPAHSARAFNGGISFKSSIILLLSHGAKTYLFLYRDGKIKRLGAISSSGWSQIEVKHRSAQRVVFLVRTHPTYERGDNSLFIFDGERLFRIKEYPELYDAAIDRSGRRIAYCYWVGNKRHIIVKELSLYGI